MAAILVAALLLIRFPQVLMQPGDAEIIVQLLAEPEPVPVEPAETIEPIPSPDVMLTDIPIEDAPQAQPAEEELEPVDWYESLDQVVQETVTTASHIDSMHPAFDEKRRAAAVKFRASRAPYEKKVWENVELDQLGRTILIAGNCSRVVDDPSAINYYMQREFTQYMVSCSYQRSPPKELPWVDGIRGRYAHLQPSDRPTYE